MKILIQVQIFFHILFIPYSLRGQVPHNYLSSPVRGAVSLSGTFGELRGSHFHKGVDIRTKKRKGLKIYAAASGYVSKVKISPWGYGKHVEITHPNGYKTLYAHLDRFNPKIEELLKRKQYQRQRNFIEVYPSKQNFPVKKGEVIGYSGNTGSSQAPHLHFEFRDANDVCYNPLSYGIKVKDNTPPSVKNVYVIPLEENTVINGATEPYALSLPSNQREIQSDEVIKVAGRIGIAVDTYDKQNSANRNGIYSIRLSVNGEEAFYQKMDFMQFHKSKYIRSHMAYHFFDCCRLRVHKCYVDPVNNLEIYPFHKRSLAKLRTEPNKTYEYRLDIIDIQRNRSTVYFKVEGEPSSKYAFQRERIPTKSYASFADHIFKVDASRGGTITNDEIEVSFEPDSFTQDVNIGLYSADSVITLYRPTTPILKKYSMYIPTRLIPASIQRDKMVVSFTDKSGKSSVRPYTYDSKTDRVHVRHDRFGQFEFKQDTLPPLVTPINISEGKWVSKNKKIKLRVRDDLSGIRTLKATLDDQWVRVWYEPKQRLISYDFSDLLLKGNKHTFVLSVEDGQDNKTEYSVNFFRKGR